MFHFDRRTLRQQRAAQALVAVVPVAALAYVPLDALFSGLLGGFWGVLAALVVVGAPVGALFRVASADRRPRQAVLEGTAIALGAAVLYAWGFGGFW